MLDIHFFHIFFPCDFDFEDIILFFFNEKQRTMHFSMEICVLGAFGMP